MRPVISPEYATLNKQLHAERPDYGINGAKSAQNIVNIAKSNGFKVVLDYGCGKGTLKPAIAALDSGIEVLEFDPAIGGKDVLPTRRVDLIAALDVMEHIEPDYLTSVLQAMADIKPAAVFLVVATTPAEKTLSDGRNAHLIVQPRAWWEKQLSVFFKKLALKESTDHHFLFFGVPLGN